MKKLLLTACTVAIALSAPAVRADDVALITFQIGKNKNPRQVALEFYPADAPETVANFEKLSRKKFYNGLAVHRIFPDTLVQTGDPLTAHNERARVGTGGPGYTLPPEIHRKHIKGAVAAGRLADTINPNRLSNGSQFLICLQPMPSYDGQYTVFGEVLWGLDTLIEISHLPVDTNDNPVQRVEIKSIKILPREQLPSGPAAPPAPNAVKKKWYQIF